VPYVNRTAKRGGVGEVSSKYGYPGGGDQFERDIVEKAEEAEALYQKFVNWMKEQEAEPETVRYMFIRFYEDYIKMGE
jgi:hypothetical protein